MHINHTIFVIFCLFNDNILLGTDGFFYDYLKKIKCSYSECCNDYYIPQNIEALGRLVNTKLFGQKIATNSILQALYSHTNSINTPKALAISFHGTSGTGKTFMASMIGEAFYKKNYESQYFHFFNGRSDFTLEAEVNRYKEMLQKKIVHALLDCPQSLFIFDEIDSMPAGVLNVLIPFLDYGKPRIWPESSNKYVETRKAIFIFITNAGSGNIVKRLIDIWLSGKSRDNTDLADFEDLISTGAFNAEGGFYKSDVISNNLIDHYIPFLPLETEHIKLCIETAFQKYGRNNIKIVEIDRIMSHLKFGPEPHNLYSTSGCKRIETKVASLVYERGLHIEL